MSQVQKWADAAMFASEKHNAAQGPKVHLLQMTPDPLGGIAACAKMYVGEVVRDLRDVTNVERRHYLSEIQKTKLAMPMEAVTFHFMLENVTRAFTHQLVRQRTAAYAQESMRFAVVEDMSEAVALPPSLAAFNDPQLSAASLAARADGLLPKNETEQRYWTWYETVNFISDGYNKLVEGGMPAEEARGLMPTNIITRVNYITGLRGLLDHAGNRLCTQAQFEWRTVFAGIATAIANYQPLNDGVSDSLDRFSQQIDDRHWQYQELARLFRPVCYQTGACQFKADFDRKCSIRERVDANANINRPSTEWGEDYQGDEANAKTGEIVFVGAIHTREWLSDHAAAR